MPAVAVSAASAAYGAYSANQAAQQQSQAMSMQQQAANAQLALEQQFMRQQQGLYGPLESQLVQQASSNQPLDYGILSSNIQNQYGQAGRDLQASLASRGLSASGIASGANTGLEIGRANALSSAFQQGLDRRRQLAMGVISRYNPGANVQGVAGAYGNLQNLYGGYAGMYGNAALHGYGNAAQGLGSLAEYMQTQPQSQTPQVPDYSPVQDIGQLPTMAPLSTQMPQMPALDYTGNPPGGWQYPQQANYSPYGGNPTVTIASGTSTNTNSVQ